MSLSSFGCMGYALVPDHERRKWDRKTQRLGFVGYGSTFGTKGYRLFDECRRKLVVRRDVTFDEADFGLRNENKIVSADEGEDTVNMESEKIEFEEAVAWTVKNMNVRNKWKKIRQRRGCLYSLDWTTGLDYWTGLLD